MKRTLHWVIGVAVIAVYLLAFGYVAVLAEGIVPKSTRQALLAAFVIGPLIVFGEALVEFSFYVIGWLTITLLTAGKIRVIWKHDNKAVPWHGFVKQANDAYAATDRALVIVGLAVLAAGLVVLVVKYGLH